MSAAVVLPSSALPANRRVAEDLAMDVSRLMDGVREEVMALMLEGCQKTASFCASLCAERIVAARREMQKRWAEERKELERLYGVPSAGGQGQQGPMASSRWPQPPQQVEGGDRAFPPIFSKPPLGPERVSQQEAGARRGSKPGAPTGVAARPLPLAERMSPFGNGTPRSPSVMNGGSPPIDSYDSTFIDAYDAVQTLEERTSMAARAMDLLDEALQAAADGCASPRIQGGGAAFRVPPATEPVTIYQTHVEELSPSTPWSPDLPSQSGDTSRPMMGGTAQWARGILSASLAASPTTQRHDALPPPLPFGGGMEGFGRMPLHGAGGAVEQRPGRGSSLGRAAVRESSIASRSSAGHASYGMADLHGS